jgi:hypothetical protein
MIFLFVQVRPCRSISKETAAANLMTKGEARQFPLTCLEVV